MAAAQGLLLETQDGLDGLGALAVRDRLVDIGEVIEHGVIADRTEPFYDLDGRYRCHQSSALR